MTFLESVNAKIMQYADHADTYSYVVFAPKSKSFKEWFSTLSSPLKDTVQMFMDSDLNIVVKSRGPELYKIAQEIVPGMYANDILVPHEVVELTQYNLYNPPPHPKSWYQDTESKNTKGTPINKYFKPSEEQEKQTRMTMQGKKYKKSDTVLKVALKESVSVDPEARIAKIERILDDMHAQLTAAKKRGLADQVIDLNKKIKFGEELLEDIRAEANTPFSDDVQDGANTPVPTHDEENMDVELDAKEPTGDAIIGADGNYETPYDDSFTPTDVDLDETLPDDGIEDTLPTDAEEDAPLPEDAPDETETDFRSPNFKW